LDLFIFATIYPAHKADEKIDGKYFDERTVVPYKAREEIDESEEHFNKGVEISYKAIAEFDLEHYEEAYRLYNEAKRGFEVAYNLLCEAEKFSLPEEVQETVNKNKEVCLNSIRDREKRMDYCLLGINYDNHGFSKT
jgi:hypothetical protein